MLRKKHLDLGEHTFQVDSTNILTVPLDYPLYSSGFKLHFTNVYGTQISMFTFHFSPQF